MGIVIVRFLFCWFLYRGCGPLFLNGFVFLVRNQGMAHVRVRSNTKLLVFL